MHRSIWTATASASTSAPRAAARRTWSAMSRPRVTGVVLAAGGSSRLGQPKQLLPYGDGTLLDHTLSTARACRFDQLICVIGGAAAEIRATVDFAGAEVLENNQFGDGCSSSIALALEAVDPRNDVL